jgi:hypothetical protein
MPSYSASDWASVRPPCSLIARSPSVPSLPVPERMTQAAFSPRSAASDRKKVSMGVREVKTPLFDGQASVGGDDVDLVGFDRRSLLGRCDRQPGIAGQNLRQKALVMRIEMQNDDESEFAIGRYRREQAPERADRPRGPANPDDRALARRARRLDLFGLAIPAAFLLARRHRPPSASAGRRCGPAPASWTGVDFSLPRAWAAGAASAVKAPATAPW